VSRDSEIPLNVEKGYYDVAEQRFGRTEFESYLLLKKSQKGRIL